MNVEPAGYNEAKRDILDIIRTRGETTAMEIALITNRTTENSSMRLMNYHKQGLLSRRKIHGKERGYSISDRGLERLEWLDSDL